MLPRPVASRPFLPGYGVLPSDEGSGLLPWEWAEERLTASEHYWCATVRPDGRPHLMPIWGLWDHVGAVVQHRRLVAQGPQPLLRGPRRPLLAGSRQPGRRRGRRRAADGARRHRPLPRAAQRQVRHRLRDRLPGPAHQRHDPRASRHGSSAAWRRTSSGRRRAGGSSRRSARPCSIVRRWRSTTRTARARRSTSRPARAADRCGGWRAIRAGGDGVRYLSVHRRRGRLQISSMSAPSGE